MYKHYEVCIYIFDTVFEGTDKFILDYFPAIEVGSILLVAGEGAGGGNTSSFRKSS